MSLKKTQEVADEGLKLTFFFFVKGVNEFFKMEREDEIKYNSLTK